MAARDYFSEDSLVFAYVIPPPACHNGLDLRGSFTEKLRKENGRLKIFSVTRH